MVDVRRSAVLNVSDILRPRALSGRAPLERLAALGREGGSWRQRLRAGPRCKASRGSPASGWKGRAFLIERWTVELPEAPDGIAIIGADDESETFRQHYFDSRGVHRVYEMTLGDGIWKLRRDALDPLPQRFSGTFDDDDKTIAGRWEKAVDGSTWEIDFDLTYRQVG